MTKLSYSPVLLYQYNGQIVIKYVTKHIIQDKPGEEENIFQGFFFFLVLSHHG